MQALCEPWGETFSNASRNSNADNREDADNREGGEDGGLRYAPNAETGECAGDGVTKGSGVGGIGGVRGIGGVCCLLLFFFPSPDGTFGLRSCLRPCCGECGGVCGSVCCSAARRTSSSMQGCAASASSWQLTLRCGWCASPT